MFERRIQQLMIRFLDQEMSPAEKMELDAWVNASADNRRFMDVYMKREEADAAMAALTAMDSKRIRQNIERELDDPGLYTLEKESNRRIFTLWHAAAAAVVLLAVVGVWYFLADREKERSSETPAEVVARLAETRPGNTRPLLTLGDGSSVLLDKIQIGGIVQKDGVQVIMMGKRSISIAAVPGQPLSKVWGTIVSIPYGQDWKVSLAGRAKVDVAPGASVAVLPAKGKATELALDGEAYFEVEHDAQSAFAVSTKSVRTEVLGTAFNIYSHDSVSITLFRGAVKVSKGELGKILAPGEEAQVIEGKNARIDVLQGVDTAERVAWRNPFFEFNNVNIKQFMRQVTRWYGMKGTKFDRRVDTVTRGLLGGGHAGKDLTLPELLTILRNENPLFFSVRDSTIYVSPDPHTSFANNKIIRTKQDLPYSLLIRSNKTM